MSVHTKLRSICYLVMWLGFVSCSGRGSSPAGNVVTATNDDFSIPESALSGVVRDFSGKHLGTCSSSLGDSPIQNGNLSFEVTQTPTKLSLLLACSTPGKQYPEDIIQVKDLIIDGNSLSSAPGASPSISGQIGSAGIQLTMDFSQQHWVVKVLADTQLSIHAEDQFNGHIIGMFNGTGALP